jgi:hypothetical protein
MENNLNIEASCGIKPLEVEDIIIGNNPSFVFKNDPDFSTIVLYDVDGNIINVNSWIECAHYVRGGWSSNLNISSIDEEKLFFIGTFIIFFVTSGIFLYLKKRRIND